MVSMYLAPIIAIFGGMMGMLYLHHSVQAYIFCFILMVIGVFLLFFARFPLYRRKIFFSFGTAFLDKKHKTLYFISYAFIISGILLSFLRLFLDKMKP